MTNKSIKLSVSIIRLRISSSVAANAEKTLKADRFISLPKFVSVKVFFLIRNKSQMESFNLSLDGSHHKKEATVKIKWLEMAATRCKSALISINKAKVSAAKIRVSGA